MPSRFPFYRYCGVPYKILPEGPRFYAVVYDEFMRAISTTGPRIDRMDARADAWREIHRLLAEERV